MLALFISIYRRCIPFAYTPTTDNLVAIAQKLFVALLFCCFAKTSDAQTQSYEFNDLSSIKNKIAVGASASLDTLSSLMENGTCWVRFTVDDKQRIKEVLVKDAPALLEQLIVTIKGEVFKLPQGIGTGTQFLLPIYYNYGSSTNDVKAMLDKLPTVELSNDGSLKSKQKKKLDFNNFFGLDTATNNIGVPVMLLPWLHLSGKIQ